MHAVVVRLTISDLQDDLVALRGQLVPLVSQAPGFVTGYWTRKGTTGLSMIVFDSEDAANAAVERIRSGMPDAATVEDIEVREVVAHAQYKVYRSTSSGGETTSPAYIANPSTNSYTDTTATPSAGAAPTSNTASVPSYIDR